MRATSLVSLRTASAPVITFLSPNPAASRRAVERLKQWTTTTTTMSEKDDPLTTTTIGSSSPLETIVEAGVSSSSFSALDLPWEAVALQCRETGTILQWIATQVNNNDDDRTSASTTTTVSSSSAAASFPHALLGIQLIASTNELSGARESLFVQMREQLSSFSSSWKLPILARWSSWTGRTIAPHHLLGTSRLPVLQLDDDTTRRSSIIQNAPSQTSGTLKELVIPTYDDAEYVHRDGQTLLERLSGSPSVTRPVTGLYRLPNGLTLRPLPTARHDRLLPGPSLIFHKSFHELESLPTNNNNTNNTATLLGGLDCQVSKIGYTGHDKHSHQPKQAKQQSRHDSGSTNTPTTAGAYEPIPDQVGDELLLAEELVVAATTTATTATTATDKV